MARPRTPVAKAKATAADIKNPGRHKGRAAPAGLAALGAAPMWLGTWGMKAFQLFKRELPWLTESHRVLVELASSYRGRMLNPDPEVQLSLQAAQELRRCLAQLGATPADESKVNTGHGDDEDPDEKHFRPATTQPPPPPKPH
jgi:hypothetical protein